MEEIDAIFDQESANVVVNSDPDASRPSVSYNYADKIVEELETEYQNMPNEAADREKEKILLNHRLKELQLKLKKVKNVKNVRRVEQNRKAHETREKIKAEIEEIKDKLYNIGLEEKGKDVTSTSLVDKTIRGEK